MSAVLALEVGAGDLGRRQAGSGPPSIEPTQRSEAPTLKSARFVPATARRSINRDLGGP